MFLIILLFLQLFIIGIDGKNEFECPKTCPLNSYDPICSRGISYASLCVLQQQICNGKIDAEVYGDREPCPKFEKEKDMEDAVAIDKNGVILRSLLAENNDKSDSSSSSSEEK